VARLPGRDAAGRVIQAVDEPSLERNVRANKTAQADHSRNSWGPGRVALPNSSLALPLTGSDSVQAWNGHSKWKKAKASVFVDSHLLPPPSPEPLTR